MEAVFPLGPCPLRVSLRPCVCGRVSEGQARLFVCRRPGLSLLEAVQGPATRGWSEPGAAWGALLGHSDGSVSSSVSPGAPIHCKESHTFPLEIRIEPDCAPGQSPASSVGPRRPGKGSQMVLA